MINEVVYNDDVWSNVKMGIFYSFRFFSLTFPFFFPIDIASISS